MCMSKDFFRSTRGIRKFVVVMLATTPWFEWNRWRWSVRSGHNAAIQPKILCFFLIFDKTIHIGWMYLIEFIWVYLMRNTHELQYFHSRIVEIKKSKQTALNAFIPRSCQMQHTTHTYAFLFMHVWFHATVPHLRRGAECLLSISAWIMSNPRQ